MFETDAPERTGTASWAALGAAGAIADLYAPPWGREPCPRRLRTLIERLDAEAPPGSVLSVCVQVATALPLLLDEATATGPVERARADALRGQAVLALAATDAVGAGSDLMSLATTARIETDRVVLDGTKRWITNACTADHLLVLARHRPQRHFTSFVWVLVPADAAGVAITPTECDLLPEAGIGDIHLTAVQVDRDRIVGPAGRGLAAFMRRVATERLAGALWAGAMCRRVLTDTQRRLAARPLGDTAAWEHPALRERFARCLVEAWRIEAACAAYLTARPGRDRFVASMLLKTAVADSLDAVLAGCAQLIGADAFRAGGLAELRAQAGMFATAGGSTGAMLAGIADHAPELLRGVRG